VTARQLLDDGEGGKAGGGVGGPVLGLKIAVQPELVETGAVRRPGSP
jgi:hypothetical protein